MVFEDIELRYFSNQVAHSDLLIIRDPCALMPLDVTTVKGFTFHRKQAYLSAQARIFVSSIAQKTLNARQITFWVLVFDSILTY